MKWPKNYNKKNLTYTVVALGGGGLLTVSAYKGEMLAAVGVDVLRRGPSGG